MKGRLIAHCCACGALKGERDKDDGWWDLVRRGERKYHRGLDFCPSCAPGLLVRSDEIQATPVQAGLLIVPVRDIYAILAALRSAVLGFDARETMGWEAAERLAPLVGFEGLPKALPVREFGFLPREIP